MDIGVLRLFITVPWIGLQCAIVVFTDTYSLFYKYFQNLAAHYTDSITAFQLIVLCFKLLLPAANSTGASLIEKDHW